MDGSLCDARVPRGQRGSQPHCPRHSPFPGSWWLPRDDAPHPVGLAIPPQPGAGNAARKRDTEKAVNPTFKVKQNVLHLSGNWQGSGPSAVCRV